MSVLNDAVTAAIRAVSHVQGVSLHTVCENAGLDPDTFTSRLNGETSWDSEEIDRIARALGLRDGWGLYAAAKVESEHRKVGERC